MSRLAIHAYSTMANENSPPNGHSVSFGHQINWNPIVLKTFKSRREVAWANLTSTNIVASMVSRQNCTATCKKRKRCLIIPSAIEIHFYFGVSFRFFHPSRSSAFVPTFQLPTMMPRSCIKDNFLTISTLERLQLIFYQQCNHHSENWTASSISPATLCFTLSKRPESDNWFDIENEVSFQRSMSSKSVLSFPKT